MKHSINTPVNPIISDLNIQGQWIRHKSNMTCPVDKNCLVEVEAASHVHGPYFAHLINWIAVKRYRIITAIDAASLSDAKVFREEFKELNTMNDTKSKVAVA